MQALFLALILGQAPVPVPENTPWLSAEEHRRMKAYWPKEVPWGNELRFYSLAPRYQNLYTMNNGTFKGRDIDPLHHEFHPFIVSGGMADIDPATWRSIKGLDIPKGKKIEVWEENVDVRAFALVPRWRWRFPAGTIAYDVLFRVEEKGWSIFEVRTQTKTDTEWSDSDTWRPGPQGWKVSRDLTAENSPPGYRGAGASCVSCHNRPAEIVSVPGRIYLRSRWGDDGRFSWRPFRQDGQLDGRWPLVRK